MMSGNLWEMCNVHSTPLGELQGLFKGFGEICRYSRLADV